MAVPAQNRVLGGLGNGKGFWGLGFEYRSIRIKNDTVQFYRPAVQISSLEEPLTKVQAVAFFEQGLQCTEP